MKNKKFYAVLMVAVMVVIGGCGKQTETNNDAKEAVADAESGIVQNNVETTGTDSDSIGSEDSDTASDEAQESSPAVTEKDDSELHMKDYHDYLEDKTLLTDDNVFGGSMFEYPDEAMGFLTTGKVPMYAPNGVRTGYIKEDVRFVVLGVGGGWCYFDLLGDTRYARLSDIEANALTTEEADAVRAEEEAQAKAQAEAVNNSSSNASPAVDNPPADTASAETPAESDKYTPEEAIAVYRSIIEAGGIAWDPSIKDVVSWGTGFMYLDKGYPEWAAETDLESFALNAGWGNPTTKHYIEVTGSDDECVYFTGWHN